MGTLSSSPRRVLYGELAKENWRSYRKYDQHGSDDTREVRKSMRRSRFDKASEGWVQDEGQRMTLAIRGLHELCFVCCQYGDREAMCQKGKTQRPSTEARAEIGTGVVNGDAIVGGHSPAASPTFWPWMVVQSGRWRMTRVPKGKSGTPLIVANENYGERMNMTESTAVHVRRDLGHDQQKSIQSDLVSHR